MNRTSNNKIRFIGLTLSAREALTSRLITLSGYAYSARNYPLLEQASNRLSSLAPAVGSYYQGLAALKKGQGNLPYARSCFEYSLSNGSRIYQARSLLALGSHAEYERDYKLESQFYLDALKVGSLDYFTLLEANRAIAIKHSLEGDGHAALRIFESLLPVARASFKADPLPYFNLVNSIAVESLEAGNVETARYYSSLALRSPFAHAYPELSETAREIEEKRAIKPAVQVRAVPVQKAEPRRSGNIWLFNLKPVSRRVVTRSRVFKIAPPDSITTSALVSICSPIRAPDSLVCL